MYGGMLYFPLKVNLFEEIAVELVEAKFGLKGTAAVMKLLCKIHKENGYYLKWNAEQCTLFTNKAGKDINEQEMQGIVDILVEKAFFDPKTYKEQGVLTSTEIQKVWLEATKRRKRDLTTLPYLLVETEEDKPDKDKTCTQKRENCTQDADIFPENAYNSKQSKESKVKESKAKESRALPPLTPPGESGGAQGNPDLDIPGYAYNRNTHNLECLMLNLEKLYITDREEIRKILKLSDYGRLGNYVWKIFNGTNWSKVNSKGGYIISVLAREKRSTGS